MSDTLTVGQQTPAQKLAMHTQIDRNFGAFDGKLKKQLAVEIDLNTGMQGPDDNVITNMVAPVVDRAVSLLAGDGVEIEFPTDADMQELYFRDVWKDKQLTIDLQKMAHNGALAGHEFLRVVVAPSGKPRIVVQDPRLMDLDWTPTDIDDITRVTEQYEMWDEKGNALYEKIVDEPTEDRSGWVETKWRRAATQTDWNMDGEPIPWPYAVGPVVHCQHLPNPNEAWGRPMVTQTMIDLNNMSNRVRSECQTLSRNYSHPLMYITGVTQDEATHIDKRPGGLVNIPAAMPGEPAREIKVAQALGDFDGLIKHLEELTEDFHREAAMPDLSPLRLQGLGVISGVALRIAHAPALDRVKVQRIIHETMLQEVCDLLMDIAELDHVVLTFNWTDPLPKDEYQDAQTMTLDQGLGASQYTTLERRGYNPQHEEELREEESANANELAQRAGAAGNPTPPPQPISPLQMGDNAMPEMGLPDFNVQPAMDARGNG